MAYYMEENVTRKVCHFHLGGGCNKEASCPFLHPSPPLGPDGSPIVCRYDKPPNGCRNLASCIFSHRWTDSKNKPRWQKRKLRVRKNNVARLSQSQQASVPKKVVRPSPSPLLDLQLPDPSPVLKPAPLKRSCPSASDENPTEKRSKPKYSSEHCESGDSPVFNDEKLKQLEQKVKLLAQDKANLAQKVIKLELNNAKLESQLEVVILPSSEDVGNLKTLKEEFLKLEETRKTIVDENHRKILSKDREIRELKSSICNFKERLETEDIELRNNQSDIEAMDKEKGELVERLAAGEGEISRLIGNLQEMENERDELDTENDDLKNKLNTLLASQNIQDLDENNMKDKIQELESQKTQSCEKLKEKDERLAHVLKEKDDLSHQLIGMEKERDDLDSENTLLQAELNKRNKEINLLKARLNLLESTTP